MRTVEEIIKDIKAQLEWRGPNDRPQGIITIPRDDAKELVYDLEELRELIGHL